MTAPWDSTSASLLEAVDVHKEYPNGTVALRGVGLRLLAGAVHGLVGANGAGKSTFFKIIPGAIGASSGLIRWKGQPCTWGGPRDALAAGIATIYQHIPLVPTLSVLENVFLGRLGWRRLSTEMEQEFASLVDRVGYEIDPQRLVGELSIGRRQMVAILQALASGAELIVMDEPTASLAQDEREIVFAVIRRLTETEGTSFLYVSHLLDEILELTDHVTILRDGRVVDDVDTSELDGERLVTGIVGTELRKLERRPASSPSEDAPVVLEVNDLRSPGKIDGVSFAVRAGEVVGLAGLLGSGRSEILHAVFGADPRASGEVRVNGRTVHRSTQAAVEAGMALVPEDRVKQGLLLEFPIWSNISLPHLSKLARLGIFPARELEFERTAAAIRSLRIVAPGPETKVGELSGGNAQKVVFAKWMFGDCSVFLLDDSTAGIDVGAKEEILQIISEFAAGGKAVVLVSSEFQELLGVAARILVVRRGRIVAERKAVETSERELVMLASGLLVSEREYAA